MAVAYAKSRVGSADQRLYVRDAVSADVVLPRFLAPNDADAWPCRCTISTARPATIA